MRAMHRLGCIFVCLLLLIVALRLLPSASVKGKFSTEAGLAWPAFFFAFCLKWDQFLPYLALELKAQHSHTDSKEKNERKQGKTGGKMENGRWQAGKTSPVQKEG